MAVYNREVVVVLGMIGRVHDTRGPTFRKSALFSLNGFFFVHDDPQPPSSPPLRLPASSELVMMRCTVLWETED
jgi:hypothetical protein